MNKKIKWTILTTSSISLSLLPVVSSACVFSRKGSNNNSANEKDYKYDINGKKFKSKEEAVKFAKEHLVELKKENIFEDCYTGKDGKEFSNFNAFYPLFKEHIEKQEVSSNVPSDTIRSYIDSSGEINGEGLNYIDLTNSGKNTTIYKAKDDRWFKDQCQAKLSYFTLNKFYMHGIGDNKKVFYNKEEFINEATKVYNEINSDSNLSSNEKLWKLIKWFSLDTKSDLKFLKFNNNYMPFVKDINNLLDDKDVETFFLNNLHEYYKIGNHYYTEEEIFNNNDLFLSNLSNFNILKINSTQGNASYIVDIDKDDEYSLNGDYIYRTPSNYIEEFKDATKWVKREQSGFLKGTNDKTNLTNNFISFILSSLNEHQTHNKVDYYNNLSEFFLNMNEGKKDTQNYFENLDIFHIADLDSITISFLKEMRNIKINESQTLLDKIVEILTIMKKGKNGNFVSQIPVLYFATLSYLIDCKANASQIQIFKSFFGRLITYLNEVLENIIGEDLYKKDNGEKLNLWDEFKANGIDADINSNINAFINIFVSNASIYNAIKTIEYATTNMIQKAGVQKFDDIKYLYNEKISASMFNKLEKLFDKYSGRGSESLINYDAAQNKFKLKDNINLNSYATKFISSSAIS
ncbi:hypothetical protein [Mycoplasmopsis adleri]|uniref:hypothetical protein n=1 Tax=Mycoplasmopsis adleri TaxID=51362 RepID=UPI003873A432